MNPSLVSVNPVSATVLELVYENSERRRFDIEPLLESERFAELGVEAVFRSARVSSDAVEWSNGVEIDSEELYLRSLPDGDSQY